MPTRSMSRSRITNGKPEALDMEPLVYYAGVMANAKHPKEAAEFVKFLQTPAGQKLLRADGYSAPKGVRS